MRELYLRARRLPVERRGEQDTAKHNLSVLFESNLPMLDEHSCPLLEVVSLLLTQILLSVKSLDPGVNMIVMAHDAVNPAPKRKMALIPQETWVQQPN